VISASDATTAPPGINRLIFIRSRLFRIERALAALFAKISRPGKDRHQSWRNRDPNVHHMLAGG
jgi:hypothetical protein